MASVGTQIGKAMAEGHNALRQIFFDKVCLELLDAGGDVIAKYDTNWYLDKREYSDVVAGRKYKRLVVDDVDGCRLSELRETVTVRVGDMMFKVWVKDSFIGSVPSYEFKLLTVGQAIT